MVPVFLSSATLSNSTNSNKNSETSLAIWQHQQPIKLRKKKPKNTEIVLNKQKKELRTSLAIWQHHTANTEKTKNRRNEEHKLLSNTFCLLLRFDFSSTFPEGRVGPTKLHLKKTTMQTATVQYIFSSLQRFYNQLSTPSM